MKHYIVTGASRGLGAAIVDALLGPEATVYAVSRSVNEDLIARSAEKGGSLRWFQHDLTDPTVVDPLVQRIARMVDETHPSMIGVFVNAAQLHPIGQAGTLDPIEIDRAVRLNVVHPIALVHRIIAAFRDRPIPIRIVLISSGASQRVMPGLSVYSATKAAINAFAKTLQAECVALREKPAAEGSPVGEDTNADTDGAANTASANNAAADADSAAPAADATDAAADAASDDADGAANAPADDTEGAANNSAAANIASANVAADDADSEANRRISAEIKVYPVSPGLIDTEMQEVLRDTDPQALPERDLYRSWQREGRLTPPSDAAKKIITLFTRTDVVPGEFIHLRDL